MPLQSSHGTPARAAVGALLRPTSVAILGFSASPGGTGHNTLALLLGNAFAGEVHLVGRAAGTFEGRPVLGDVDALPDGVDLAVLAVPARVVREAVTSCVRRKIKGAVIFASGFAEMGEAGRVEQEQIGAIAKAGNLALIGPNCLGFSNYVDRIQIGFASRRVITQLPAGTTDAVGIVTQSGGLGGHLFLALGGRGVPVSYMISTGNEVDIGLGDFVDHLASDASTRVIAIYAEHIRRPDRFLAACGRARAAGKPIVMLHSGRGAKAQAAAQSHTGALTGDHAVMRTFVEAAGVVLVDTLDELLDCAEILARYPRPSPGGLGVLTCSGAFCGLAHDFSDDLGIDIPALSPATEAHLKPLLPAFMPANNPLDLGTQTLQQPDLMQTGIEALLGEPRIGALAISIPASTPQHAITYITGLVASSKLHDKPVALAILGDNTVLPQAFLEIARAHNVVLWRSADRMMRAMAHVLTYGNRRPVVAEQVPPLQVPPLQVLLPALGSGTQAEWLGKQVLAALGISVPQGGLATSREAAVAIATRIGGPVAMKAQAAQLAHKTEAGGVLLSIVGADRVAAAWDEVSANIARVQPGLRLDGVLVEAMADRGLELVVGARRDPHWGPVLLVGLGGLWVEVLHDIRLLPATAARADVIETLGHLKTAKLLRGFRGAPAVDLGAVADVAIALGRLLLARTDILEIEINPLSVHAHGHGATALDALIVTHTPTRELV